MTTTRIGTLLERSRHAGRAHAIRYPKKAAALLVRLRATDIPSQHARGNQQEVERLSAIAEGIEDVLTLDGTVKLCKRCGETLKDDRQPGWEHGLGPVCFDKERQR